MSDRLARMLGMDDTTMPIEFLEQIGDAGLVPALVPVSAAPGHSRLFYGAFEITNAAASPSAAALVACVVTTRRAREVLEDA